MSSNEYTVKTCGRCGGSGKYSKHLTYGTDCMRCGGTGKVIATRGIAAKAVLTDRAEIGDIVYQRSVYYRVDGYRWYDPNKEGNELGFNQQIKLTRLVDGKTFRSWRVYRDESGKVVTPPPEQITGTWI